MSNIKARIATLQSLLLEKDTADIFDGPLEGLDPISRSIVETARELEVLNTTEKMEAYCREHNTTPEEIKGIIRLFRTGHYD